MACSNNVNDDDYELDPELSDEDELIKILNSEDDHRDKFDSLEMVTTVKGKIKQNESGEEIFQKE